MKKIVLSLIGILIILVVVVWFHSPTLTKQAEDYTPPRNVLVDQNFDPITIIPENSGYISYTVFRETIATAQATPAAILSGASGKTIRIDTAEELYWFSIDVSYNPHQFYVSSDPAQNVKLSYAVIEVLLSLNYALGNDIDYSIMKSKQFIPIGYSFYSVDETLKHNIFTGTFDGRGFEISNLYFAGYDFITTVEEITGVTVDIALSPYYAMFTYNAGTIKNVGLLNPTLELLSDHEDINRAANLVGKNTGTVEFVYVRDSRVNAFDAGIRMRVPPGTTANRYTAAGIVYENTGTFRDSYYASRVVVNGSYINNFLVQPVLYLNSGTISNVVYDSTIYLLQLTVGSTTYIITTPNAFALGESTTNLKSGQSVLASSQWYFYEQDTYPILLGLNFNGQAYEIATAIDLFAFSKLVFFNTAQNNVLFRNAQYVLVNDIDMSVLARGAYRTPSIEFTGKFSGLKLGGGNYYIHHLHIINGRLLDGSYYSGLFGLLSGEVSNITIASSSITFNNTPTFYSATFRVGMIAGRLTNGKITNVSVNATMNLGTRTIGRMYVGGIAGQASGEITNVYTTGSIQGGLRTYNTEFQVTPTYYFGGIVGAADAAKLTMYNVLNDNDIDGISNTGGITTQGTTVTIAMGGVIGFVQNTSAVQHSLGLMSNEGTITINNFAASIPITQYAGGIFGLSQGQKYTLNASFGNWENRGHITANATNASTITRTAGIGVSNHSENTEFILLTNKGNFTTASYTNFHYTSLIYDMSASSGVTISQASNEANYNFTTQPTNFSPVFHSENNVPALLRFVENKGDLTYSGFTTSAEMRVAGITLSSNVNFLNVYYSGTILLHSIIATHPMSIAGITYTLSSNRYIRNSLNEGEIIVAGINSSANIYVGGLVVVNVAGDLHTQDASNVPVATAGIINSINFANLSSTHSSVYGITGFTNVYAGGVATLNSGSIQDSANLGDILFANLSDINISNISIASDSSTAGRVNSFVGGITVGGISAAVVDGQSRIYDAVNSGDIIGIAKNYVRSGGILAVALESEVLAGGVSASSTISDSILSNCVNYGSISAITETIGTYNDQESSSNVNYFAAGNTYSTQTETILTRISTQERPAIYAAAGGVIGYGLSTMRRMISHGNVSSTDVAGGIVGATYNLGTNSGSITTTVNIDTAINYGSIRAANNGNYLNINKENISYANISTYFYAVDSTFLFPVTRSDIRRYPEGKRGFGGIFGRLQRGLNGIMTAEGGIFNFIVNTDPNIDLIGRLDQVYNFTSSARYFRFNDCIYFSARENDTTQAVFSGFTYQTSSLTYDEYDFMTSQKRTTYTRGSRVQGQTYWWTETIEYYIISGDVHRKTDSVLYDKVGLISTLRNETTTSSTTPLPSNQYRTVSTTTFTANSTAYPSTNHVITENYDPPINVTYQTTVTSSSEYTIQGNIDIDEIKEDPMGSYGEFMYDENFVMRDDDTTLPNGESITSYIFYVENGLLSERFQTTRPYGMYVLSTTAGSAYGSVLPANMDLTKIYRLAEAIPFDTNYEQIDMGYKDIMPEDEGVRFKYTEMIQTLYNDKSHLIEEEQTIYLDEISGSQSELIDPNIDYVNRTITYNISLEAFDSLQTVAYYRIATANIPVNALIGASIEDFDGGSYIGNLDGFRHLLYLEKDALVSINVAPTLAVNIGDYMGITEDTMPIYMGEFVSYSEASLNNTIFMNEDYFTKYDVYVVLKPKLNDAPGTIGITSVVVDGTTYTPDTFYNYPVQQTIQFHFTDTAGLLSNGTDIIDFVTLYYGGTLVSAQYYTLTSQPVNGGLFSFTFTLSPLLKSGEYIVYYRYFFAGTTYDIDFVKAGSNNKEITALSHYSYDEFTPFVGNTFTTYINFGVSLDFSVISWQTTENQALPAYLHNTSHTVSFLNNFDLSPFASIDDIVYVGESYSFGYKIHQVTYTIRAENNTTSVYTQYIMEREIDVEDAFKDNNRVSLDNIFATREAEVTLFALDLGIDSVYATSIYNLENEDPSAYFSISVTGETFGGTGFTPEEILGITYSTDVLLYIAMDYQAQPGFYYFTIRYHRGTEIVLVDTVLTITKNYGVNAYLSDIRFSETANETAYANIFISDNAGTVITGTGYSLRVYFAGIDYDDADLAGFVNFRIDGQVANTPLNEYSPYFLNYLPYGATIARRAYDSALEQWYWTDEVDLDSPDEDKAQLATDFTIFPDTGMEGSEGNDVTITYRVISEDNQTQVYYHITVVDIVYNVSLLFTVYYVVNDIATLAYNTILNGKAIIINVKNFNTDIEPTPTVAGTVASFPSFTQIVNYNNNTTQFHVPYNDIYRYSFGRNVSGFYTFRIQLERDQNGNDLYEYYITFGGDPLNDVSDYVADALGKYYYIETGTRNRTRRFNVYISLIEEIETNTLWGLTDYYYSWEN